MAGLRFVFFMIALLALMVCTAPGGLFDITCGENEEPVLFSDYEATDVTSTSARLTARCTRCRLEGGAQVCFVVQQGGHWTNMGEYQTVTKMQDFSAVITGLAPGTLYHFYATYDGESFDLSTHRKLQALDSIDNRFTTLSLVETVDATYPSTTMALLRGNLPDLGGASSVEVYFLWGESPGVYTHESPRQTVTAPGEFTQMITGPFNIGSTYYFVAKAGAGQGEEKSFTVL